MTKPWTTWATRAATVLALGSATAACAREDAGDQSTATAATVSRSDSDGAPAVRDTTLVTVYKSPTCGCCTAWVDHMRASGFRVVAIDTNDVDTVKRRHGVAEEHGSCHTAVVGAYVLEGHVPAADVRRLLAERPAIAGLAVPGMPAGSPGMEGPVSEPYRVIAFTRGGGTSVFATH